MADRRYYTEGSSARQLNYDDRAGRNRSREAVVRGSAAPARRPQPSVRPERSPQPARRKKQGSSHLTDRERREVAAIIVAVALCCYLLKLTSDVKSQKESVATLKSQVATQLDENASYSAGLDSMTDLDEIYNIATTKLGMVYSQPGQTLYYSQNNDDYVVQYKDVPKAK